MKNLATLLVFGFASALAFSQTPRQVAGLTIYSENGETFTITLNNKLKNEVPKSNVKIQNLTMMKYQMHVDFTKETIADFDKAVYLNPGYNVVYMLTKNRKGETVLRPQSQSPINTMAQTTMPNNNVTYTQNQNVRTQPNTNVTYTQTTTAPNSNVTYRQTTTTTTVPNTSMNVNIGNPTGVNVNVNVSDPLMNNSTTYTQTTTTTTSSSTPVYNNNTTINRNNGRCGYPMSNSDFQSAYNSIKSKSFDDTKLTVAKQIINSNCMKTSQVKQLMSLFGFESTKLSLAKYAYMHTYDPNNYYQLNDAFSYSSSIDELNTYINGMR